MGQLDKDAWDKACARPVVVATLAAASMPEVVRLHEAGARVILCGSEALDMAVAAASFPGAVLVFADPFRPIGARRLMAAAGLHGGIDLLALAGPGVSGDGHAGPLGTLGLILSALPLMRGRRGARIVIRSLGAGARASVAAVARRLASDGGSWPQISVQTPVTGSATSQSPRSAEKPSALQRSAWLH